MATGNLDPAGIELGDGFVAAVGQSLEQGAAYDRFALPACVAGPCQWRAGGQNRVEFQPQNHLNRRPHVHNNRVGLDQTVEGLRVGGCPGAGSILHFPPPTSL